MPCYGPTPAEDAARRRKEMLARNKKRYGAAETDLDIATRVACELGKALEQEGQRPGLPGTVSLLARKWLVRHEELDYQRRENKRASRRLKSRRTAALDKLTVSDKRLLGLGDE